MENEQGDEREIHCPGCGKPLATVSNGILCIHFREKEVRIILAGTIWLECWVCEELIRIDG